MKTEQLPVCKPSVPQQAQMIVRQANPKHHKNCAQDHRRTFGIIGIVLYDRMHAFF
jgi:hypothetical protein